MEDVAEEEPNGEAESAEAGDSDGKEIGTLTASFVQYSINYLFLFISISEKEETVRRSEKELQFEEFIRR